MVIGTSYWSGRRFIWSANNHIHNEFYKSLKDTYCNQINITIKGIYFFRETYFTQYIIDLERK